MSDEVAPPSDGGGPVTSAPASSPAPSPAPAQTDAPAKSAREAVQRAFAKTGANEPSSQSDAPQATADAKPEGDRLRGPDGKFIAKEGEPEKPKRQYPARFVKDHAPHWDSTPEPIQAEIDRAIAEMQAGIEKHRPGSEAFEALKAFDERARRGGTTLVQALQNYTGIEDMLRSNPVQGFVQIARNIGVHPVAIAQHIMRMAQAQQNGQQVQPQFNPQQFLSPVLQQVQALKAEFEEMQTAPLKQQIEQMQAEKPFFEILRPKMAKLVTDGKAHTLADAYEMAVAENPQIKEAVDALAARKAAEAQQQRQIPEQIQEKARLSVTGSPTVGSNPSNRKPAGSAREAVQNALTQVGLR